MKVDGNPKIVDVDIKTMTVGCIVLTIALSILFVILNSVLHGRYEVTFTFWDILIFFICYLLLVIAHELFHLIGFIVFGKAKWSDIDYGFNLKLGVAYAHTSKILPNHAMKKAVLLPFWTTGVLPTAIGFMMDNFLILLLGAFLIAGAFGDMMMYKELRKLPNDAMVKDHPTLPVLYIYDSKKSSN